LPLILENDVDRSEQYCLGLIKAIPHGKVVQIEHCGHSLMAEQPDAVLNALFTFSSQ
jgi:pimeloyl-ACP methyl ester carboxylesterase